MTGAVRAAAMLMMAGAAAAAEPRLVVVLAFEEQASDTLLDAMQGEVDRIFERARAEIEVLVLKGALEVRHATRIIHMDVKGTCASTAVRRKRSPSTLAAMFGVDRELQPIGSVDCRALSAYLGTVTTPVFGRALGRVLAHEVYHYVTQRREHSDRGLFAASLSDISLTSAELAFTDHDLATLNGSLRRISGTDTEADAGF
jgi:hypothetical protein